MTNQIILCNGPYKTGSTLLYDLLRIAFNQTLRLDEVEYSPNNKLEIRLTRENILVMQKIGGVFILKAHCYSKKVLTDLRKNGVSIATTRRSYGEVALSHYHHFRREKLNIPFWFYLIAVLPFKIAELSYYESVAKEFVNYSVQYSDLGDPKASFEALSSIEFFPDFANWNIVHEQNRKRSPEERLRFSGMMRSDWFYSRKPLDINRVEKAIMYAVIKLSSSGSLTYVSRLLFAFRVRRLEDVYFGRRS
jgi:DNA repair exonuclease SbcCD nuclease subunit